MRLTIAASDPRIGSALDAARLQLAEWSAQDPAVGPALAALALGDQETAGQVIHLLSGSQRADGLIDLPPGTLSSAAGADEHPDGTPLYLNLLAHYLAWTADLHRVREEWGHVLRAIAHSPATSDHPAAASWAEALYGLVIAAESIGEMATATHFRGLLDRLSGSGGMGIRPIRGGEEGEAERVVDQLIYELLGAEPDAPKNRLRLRPALPEEWESMDLTHLRFGDAEISLHYRKEEMRHHFTLSQESGAVPVRVIFEPLLPMPRLVRARVDGEDAVLDPIPSKGRLMVPIQIVLDDERRIELEGGSPVGRARIPLPVRQASD
jgi:hypothetical protein